MLGTLATVETRCKASVLPPRLGSLRLPHFPQPRWRIYLQTINLGGGSFLLDRGGLFLRCQSDQQLPDWIGAHNRMVEFFGGSARIWVPDQLKSGVTVPYRYEPGLHRTYQEAASHYGAVVIPARPYKARDKAKVEAGVLIAQRWILARLRNRTFFSLGALNTAIGELLVELNQKPMQQLRASRKELFERLDRPALQPLPANRYEPANWKICRASIFCGVSPYVVQRAWMRTLALSSGTIGHITERQTCSNRLHVFTRRFDACLINSFLVHVRSNGI